MSGPVAIAKAVVGVVSVEIADGRPPFTVSVAGAVQSKPSRVFGFMNVEPGTHRVHAVDGAGREVEVEVLVP